MLITTIDVVPGKRVTKVLGLCRGNTIRARHIGRDILASLRNLVGGEVIEYTKMMAEAREQAIDRMVGDAQSMGANAIVGFRLGTAEMMEHAAEIVAYGTAVVVDDE